MKISQLNQKNNQAINKQIAFKNSEKYIEKNQTNVIDYTKKIQENKIYITVGTITGLASLALLLNKIKGSIQSKTFAAITSLGSFGIAFAAYIQNQKLNKKNQQR